MKKSKKNKNLDSNLVFSTGEEGNSFFNHIKLRESLNSDEEEVTTENNKASMSVRVYRDRKQRKGKEATIITGLDLFEDELKELGKELKSACGSGGTVKDGEILVQGNFVDKVIEILKKKGYTNTKRTGG